MLCKRDWKLHAVDAEKRLTTTLAYSTPASVFEDAESTNPS
jgi:hypothetical protein